MEILPALSALLALLLPILQYWISKKPERIQERLNETVQTIRREIASGDANAITVRIDSLPKTSNSSPKLGDAEDTKRRLGVLGIK